ncbi:amidohydrolase family protein [Streptomyces sp. A7024]|uniref:Amidohydrolase family protein n=1 Tax=Streptomyces coryli TaxID=1128680 RepID=A0A6G4TU65_9ACTN|nr:amidohydrolase family protein [Streptomyces coryli]NGN63090.1 amidohydrolase family protein [Streptomyces coryli]
MDLRLPPLVDHHCHGVLRTGPEPAAFERYLTESEAPAAPGTSYFDSQLGFAVRRWCPPLLDLEPHCPPEVYLARRSELGADEATRRLLQGAGIGAYVVDTGLPGDQTAPAELAALAGGTATAHEIVRLETLAERLAAGAASGADLLDAVDAAVPDAARTAAGFKSIAAYRHGLDFDPAPPAREEAERAAARWLDAGGGRLEDPVLIRHLLWSAVRTGLPLQLHTGFGDTDLTLHRADPLLLTGFLRATAPLGAPIVLLHGYPYHRHAAYLAAVFPHVHADVGLALSHTGARAEAVLAEVLELVPFGKLLFSTDAYALPELYVAGAQLFRAALTRLLTRWTGDGSWSAPDAHRVAALLAAGNSRRVYGLPG